MQVRRGGSCFPSNTRCPTQRANHSTLLALACVGWIWAIVKLDMPRSTFLIIIVHGPLSLTILRHPVIDLLGQETQPCLQYTAPCPFVLRYVPSIPCHLKVCGGVYNREFSMRFSTQLHTKPTQTCRGYAPSSPSPLRSALTLQPQNMPVPKGTLPGAHVRLRSKQKLPSPSSAATLPYPWTTRTQNQTQRSMSRCSKCPRTRRRRREVLYSILVGRV